MWKCEKTKKNQFTVIMFQAYMSFTLDPAAISSRRIRVYDRANTAVEYRSGSTYFPATQSNFMQTIKEQHSYFTYHPKRPPSYAEAVGMQKLQATRQRRSTVNLSASSAAVTADCAEMFFNSLQTEYDHEARCFDPVYMATLFHSKSKHSKFESTRQLSHDPPASYEPNELQCSADYSDDISAGAYDSNGTTKTTIILRPQQQKSIEKHLDSDGDQILIFDRSDGSQQRRSAVEAQGNNSIYGRTDGTVNDKTSDCNGAEKENKHTTNPIFVTVDDGPKADDSEYKLSSTIGRQPRPDRNHSETMLRRRSANLPSLMDCHCEMNGNTGISAVNLPAKFPVSYQESEMARKRPMATVLPSTNASQQRVASSETPKLAYQHAKILSKQQRAHIKQQKRQNSQQTTRDRRSRSQPLCQHRQMSASVYGINEGDVIHDIVPATAALAPQNYDLIDYGSFAVDHSDCNYALPSTSSTDLSALAAGDGAPSTQSKPDDVIHRRRRIDFIRGAAIQRHVSRMDRFSIDSEAGMSSQDSGIRSSTHSNSSTVTTRSSIGTNFADSYLIVEAIWDHVAMMSNELPFRAGDVITVLDASARVSNALWYGSCKDSSGWFPASYVRMKNGDLASANVALDDLQPPFPPRDEIGPASDNLSSSAGVLLAVSSPLSSSGDEMSADDFPLQMRRLRRRVIEELLDTERDYVRLLQNLVQGFVEQCRRRKELFSDERIARIFGNIEQIYSLHVKLLRGFESHVDANAPENSCLGGAFLRNNAGFGVYTEYCNNRPVSCSELALLVQNAQYYHFFEACRLLRGMAKLSLEGFLLTPVQRICRYPLQLVELIKATPQRHRDRVPLEQAHAAMRAVAVYINDAKRRVDAIQKIVLWQKNVHGFRGPDLIDNNHRMLISGEMHCRAIQKSGGAKSTISVQGDDSNSNQKTDGITTAVLQWSKTVHVYLFDQSIILCKKDVLKKNCLIFKERMSLQSTSVQDIHNGKEPITGANLRNSFKLIGPSREYIFTCPDPATKGLWLEALWNRPRPQPPSAAERRLAIITLNYLN